MRTTWMLLAALCACGEDATSATSATGSAGAAASGGAGASSGDGGFGDALACEQVPAAVDAFKASHMGNGGKDWDINAKSEADIAAEPAAKQLRDLCGPAERPVIPQMAWEYGGNDHPWIAPESSAYFYCVYIPVDPGTEHWMYDAGADHVTADVTIGCPADNPCNDETGADQVLSCLGDSTNIEILVDTASLDDGADAGLSLSEASTDLYLVLADETKVHLHTDQ